jgi:hypothetical protein
MFSFSLRWLWAQCLLVGAGFYLLGWLAHPGPGKTSYVAGKVENVAVISRKGLGSFYELQVLSDDGDQQRVLIARRVAPEAMARGLVGHSISAHVNLSSEAIDFATDGYTGVDASRVRQAAQGEAENYDRLAFLFGTLGIAIGLATIVLFRHRASKT